MEKLKYLSPILLDEMDEDETGHITIGGSSEDSGDPHNLGFGEDND